MKVVGDSRGDILLPEITEEDIWEIENRWGMSFDPPRREILRSNSSFDVMACPGSGKTTLLVAKLAILAKRWSYSRRGICVLSHTNVARKEIEERLSGIAAGGRLLAYPHFIGTIHGFVNQFLAQPLLRSEGRLVSLIDDEVCFSWMKKYLLAKPVRFGLGQLVHHERTLDDHIRRRLCAGDAGNLAFMATPSGLDDRQWRTLKGAKLKATARGFYCHADMLFLAERLLQEHVEVANLARWRFPVVLIDETQDTSEIPSRVLAHVFPRSGCVLRQRFGDSNQAIYDRGQTRPTTDPFPGSEIRWLTNSQRFGQAIATKAHPLAPDQPKQQLLGSGPPRSGFPELSDQALPHTIFFFSLASEKCVLPAFAQLLLEVFPAETLCSKQFLARAIGFVGRAEGKAKGQREIVPRSLRDYWPEYEPRVAKIDPRPEKLADFIHLAQRQRASMADCAQAVSTVLRGIIELIELVVPNACAGSGRTFKGICELLVSDQLALRTLERLLWRWCIEAVPLSKSNWSLQLRELKEALAPILVGRQTEMVRPFCEWSTAFAEDASSGTRNHGLLNRYQFPEKDPRVAIDVGTIHSAKGQTHTATLVLETFANMHDVGDLLDWLVGDKHGAGKEKGLQRLERLRLIYTAMTRPTHLLCIAMREKVLDVKGNREATIAKFRSRGWQVKYL